MSILIKNGFVVLPDKMVKADIHIEGSRIKRIAPHIDADADEVIDAAGLAVMAGLVDMHCHLREPGQEHKEDIESGAAAALRGGYTSVACMPNTLPVVDNAALVRYVAARGAEAGLCKVYPIAAATKGQKGAEITEMGFLKAAGAVAVSDDGRPIENSSVMRNALNYAKTQGVLLISHPEDVSLSAGCAVNEGYNSTISGLKGISRAAEEIMIARDIILAKTYDAPVHIAHVSTEGGVELIRQAKRRGVRVTAETCPHYFAATDDEILNYNTSAKINPPLREDSDVEAVIRGLADGTLDVIATDHAPHHVEEKTQEFDLAPFGTVGLETAFSVAYTYLVDCGDIELTKLSKLMSATPASLLGIGGGVLAEGALADIMIADLNESYVVDSRKFKSKGRNSVFEGWHLKGKVVCVIVDGEVKERS
ncbi:MAG: dihydroorotase [Firmicutes bacterium]|nr:dihydroorotase [Bacillota bacterium]